MMMTMIMMIKIIISVTQSILKVGHNDDDDDNEDDDDNRDNEKMLPMEL